MAMVGAMPLGSFAWVTGWTVALGSAGAKVGSAVTTGFGVGVWVGEAVGAVAIAVGVWVGVGVCVGVGVRVGVAVGGSGMGGLQSGLVSALAALVRLTGLLPSAFITKISLFPVRLLKKAICAASGDQVGRKSSPAALVRRVGWRRWRPSRRSQNCRPGCW